LKCPPYFFTYEVRVLQNVPTTRHSRSAHIADVVAAVVEPINWRAEIKGTGIETVLEASHAVRHGSSEFSDCEGVADGCADSPAAVSALDVGEPAGFDCVPLIDTTSSFASDATAAEAGQNFVGCVHMCNTIIL
jgi:hypothetical protein